MELNNEKSDNLICPAKNRPIFKLFIACILILFPYFC